jgi:probable HAF family extracellular repeat protein
LNDEGHIAGQAATADGTLHAFFWQRGLITDLGNLPAYDQTCIGAFGINSKDQVVGQAVENYCSGPGAHAFLWENSHIIDLNVFVPPGSGVTLGDVEQINDRGEMFGSATLPNGDAHAFLLIPCDENHPDVEGCDYSLMDAPVAMGQTSPAVRDASSRAFPHSPMRRMNRYHFPGRAFAVRN